MNEYSREYMYVSHNLLKTDNTDIGRKFEGIWGLSFLKMGVTLAVLTASGKTPC